MPSIKLFVPETMPMSDVMRMAEQILDKNDQAYRIYAVTPTTANTTLLPRERALRVEYIDPETIQPSAAGVH